MNKFTFVYNSVSYDGDVEHRFLEVDKVEGQDMKDAIYNHWQKVVDEDIIVDEVRIFEGDLTETEPNAIMPLAYYNVRNVA
jgi:hypothetical protein